MSQQFYTYVHYRPDGTPFYVGKGLYYRASSFTASRNERYKRTVKKYGKENLGMLLIACESELQAKQKEIELIALFRACDEDLCNYTDGGDGTSGRVATPEQCKNISKALKAKLARDPEYREMQRQKLLQINADPGMREKIVASRKKNLADPVEKERQYAPLRVANSRPENKARLLALSKDPELNKDRAARFKKLWDENPDAMRSRMQKVWEAPKTEKQKESARTLVRKLHTPENWAKVSAANKGLISITKDGKNTRVHDAAPYLVDGWSLGVTYRVTPGRKPSPPPVPLSAEEKSARKVATKAKMSAAHKKPENIEISRQMLALHARTPEAQAKISASLKKLRWINKDGKNIRVEVVESYLVEGWVLGRLMDWKPWKGEGSASLGAS